MAKKEFILQGFTKRTHAAAARELFDVDDIQRVIISVAFVSASGVRELEKQLKPTKAKVFVLAGIRNDITSYQALVALHELAGNVYTVDTGSRSVLFHPKLYLVRGKTRARLLVGSANLTLGGLNNNIEAGMMIDFDLTDATDKVLVDDVEKQLTELPADYPDHIVKVKSKAMLDALLEAGRVVDEMAMPAPRPSTATTGKGSDTITRIKLQVPALRSVLTKAKAAAKPAAVKTPTKKTAAKGAKQAAVAVPPMAPLSPGVEMELVWESKPLSERDLSIPTGSNTHATGSINLDKGLLPPGVDHRHYFRDDVFNLLDWQASKTPMQEEAYAKFQLVLKGISAGEFDLRIAHSNNIESRTYKQRNAMSSLGWGPARSWVGKPDLIGRTLALFRDKADPTRFLLEID